MEINLSSHLGTSNNCERQVFFTNIFQLKILCCQEILLGGQYAAHHSLKVFKKFKHKIFMFNKILFLTCVSQHTRVQSRLRQCWTSADVLLDIKVQYIYRPIQFTQVSGYVRNNSLNVNRLVHAVGWGNFRVKRIVKVHENCPYSAKEKVNKVCEFMQF